MDENGEYLGQTGTLDAARFALDTGAKTLILTHTGKDLSSPAGKKKALEDISAVFSGTIIFAEELTGLPLW
jgi:ribonuclease BN (tRNA processing enzyme)